MSCVTTCEGKQIISPSPSIFKPFLSRLEYQFCSSAAWCPLNELYAAHSSLFRQNKADSYTSSHQLKITLHQSDCAEKPVLHLFMLHLSKVDTNPNEVPIVGVACHCCIELLPNSQQTISEFLSFYRDWALCDRLNVQRLGSAGTQVNYCRFASVEPNWLVFCQRGSQVWHTPTYSNLNTEMISCSLSLSVQGLRSQHCQLFKEETAIGGQGIQIKITDVLYSIFANR